MCTKIDRTTYIRFLFPLCRPLLLQNNAINFNDNLGVLCLLHLSIIWWKTFDNFRQFAYINGGDFFFLLSIVRKQKKNVPYVWFCETIMEYVNSPEQLSQERLFDALWFSITKCNVQVWYFWLEIRQKKMLMLMESKKS